MKKQLNKKELNKISGGKVDRNGIDIAKAQHYVLLQEYKIAQEELIIAKLEEIIMPGALSKAQIAFDKAEDKLMKFDKSVDSSKL